MLKIKMKTHFNNINILSFTISLFRDSKYLQIYFQKFNLFSFSKPIIKIEVDLKMLNFQQLSFICKQAFTAGNQRSSVQVKSIMSKAIHLPILLSLIQKDQNIFCCFCSVLRQSINRGDYQMSLAVEGTGSATLDPHQKMQQIYALIMAKLISIGLLLGNSQNNRVYKLCIQAMGSLFKGLIEAEKSDYNKCITTHLLKIYDNIQNTEELQNRIYLVLSVIQSCLSIVNISVETSNKMFESRKIISIFQRHVCEKFHKQIIYSFQHLQAFSNNSLMAEKIFQCFQQLTIIYKIQQICQSQEPLQSPEFNEIYIFPKWIYQNCHHYVSLFSQIFTSNVGKDQTKSIWCLNVIGNLFKGFMQRQQIEQDLEEKQNYAILIIVQLIQSRINHTFYFRLQSSILSLLLFFLDNYGLKSVQRLLSDINMVTMILQYLQKVMKNCELRIEEGSSNPLTICFRILAGLYKCNQGHKLKEISICSQFLQLFSSLLSSNTDSKRQEEVEFPHYKEELEMYIGCFQPMKKIFELQLSKNIEALRNSKFQFGDNQKNLTIFCLYMLNSPKSDRSQCQVLLLFFERLRLGGNFCYLYIIDILVKTLMPDDYSKQGQNSSYLASVLEQIRMFSFEDFINVLINEIIGTFINSDSYIIQYGLDLLHHICNQLNLRQAFCQEFDPSNYRDYLKCSRTIQQFIRNANLSSLRSQTNHREQLYEIVGMLWIQKNVKSCYQIYNIVKAQLSTGHDYAFINYLSDCTGLLKSIKLSSIFQLMVQLICWDIPKIHQFFLSPQKKQLFLLDYNKVEIYLKFLVSISEDIFQRISKVTNSTLPFLIQSTFNPIFEQLSLLYSEQIQDLLMNAYLHFSRLNTQIFLLPLPQKLRVKKRIAKAVIGSYFSQLSRYENIQSMLEYCGLNTIYLNQWLQQIKDRKLRPSINFQHVISVMSQQHPCDLNLIAKITYDAGRYSSLFCDIGQLSEKEFIKAFINRYETSRVYGP